MSLEVLLVLKPLEITWMLEQTGFVAEEWRNLTRSSTKFTLLNWLALGRLKDFLTKQYLVRARLDSSWQEQFDKSANGKGVASESAHTAPPRSAPDSEALQKS